MTICAFPNKNRKIIHDWVNSEIDCALDDLDLSSDQARRTLEMLSKIKKKYDIDELRAVFSNLSISGDANDILQLCEGIAAMEMAALDVLLAAARMCGRIVQLEDELIELRRESLRKV